MVISSVIIRQVLSAAVRSLCVPGWNCDETTADQGGRVGSLLESRSGWTRCRGGTLGERDSQKDFELPLEVQEVAVQSVQHSSVQK